MKNSRLQFMFAMLTLVMAGALEELLPKPLEVGFPLLLAAVQFFGARWNSLAAVAFAIAAGSVEDSLSSLPLFTSVSYFVLVVLLIRRSDLPRAAMLLTYPCYQIWLNIWTPVSVAGVFLRLLFALPIGFATVCAVVATLAFIERKAAICEAG